MVPSGSQDFPGAQGTAGLIQNGADRPPLCRITFQGNLRFA